MKGKKYDVVIVGTGVAGLFAALHLSSDKKILMITKADLCESDSYLAQGGICVLRDENDYDAYFEDTMKAGHYENTKESVDIMIRNSQETIRELINYGVDFHKVNGKYDFTKEGAHSVNRILYHDDETGKEITTKLLEKVQKLPNVEIRTFTTMIDILCKDNICEGILISNKDDLTCIFAKDVIWACGGIGGVYDNSTNFSHLTGDSLAIAIKRNIEIKDINYVQIHPTSLYSEEKGRRFLISESCRGEGAVLLDKNMKRFTDELQPRDVVSKAIFTQMKKDGTKHVWLSFKNIKDIDVKKRFPNIYEHCLKEGYDITKEPIPVVPAQHYFMGGVKIDSFGKTTMQNLYSAGETCCNGVHGKNRLASNSLLESLVFAKRAAEDINKKILINLPNYISVDNGEIENMVIENTYDISLKDYADLEKYQEICKSLVRKEIERVENGYNHKEAQCG